MKCYSSLNVTLNLMSHKVECHSKWNVTQMECHSKWNFTQNGMSHERGFQSKWNVTEPQLSSLLSIPFQVAYIKSMSRQSNINFQKQGKRGRWDDQLENEGYRYVVNAYYQILENKVYFPSFILDGWVFNALRPDILNIPSMCWLLAHEIFHGFDSEGHKYSYEGLYLTVSCCQSLPDSI